MYNPSIQTVIDNFPNARPEVGLILGSGWGAIADMFDIRGELDYFNIPAMGAPGVSGHAGRLLLGSAAGTEALIFQGRRHWYENAGWEPVLLPVRICRAMGVGTLIITNAAGGIRADLAPGSLMLIEDHINAMGVNPLLAREPDECEPFFNDQSALYDPCLRRHFKESTTRAGLVITSGVYLAVSGPSYETPAEIRMFRAWGADAIGMSTVPEAMLGHALGLRVSGLSCIANAAAGTDARNLNHTEVTTAIAAAVPDLRKILAAAWPLPPDGL